jgi:hypothetical protein
VVVVAVVLGADAAATKSSGTSGCGGEELVVARTAMRASRAARGRLRMSTRVICSPRNAGCGRGSAGGVLFVP